LHEIHRTDDRALKHELQERAAMLERVLSKLPAKPGEAAEHAPRDPRAVT
jgi:hypothetical protein